MTAKPGYNLLLAAFVAVFCASGCAYTIAGTKLAPIDPPAPTFKPRVEYTVGDFSFTLEGGKMVTSHYAGHLLNSDLMESWKDRGYVAVAEEVDGGRFTNGADYTVTLSGSQYGESSIALQILSGLTLFLIPSSVVQHYDIQYTLEDPATKKKYSASVQESDEVVVELFLLLALPWQQRGHQETVRRMGDHLYEQLYRQGAFQRAAAAPATSP